MEEGEEWALDEIMSEAETEVVFDHIQSRTLSLWAFHLRVTGFNLTQVDCEQKSFSSDGCLLTYMKWNGQVSHHLGWQLSS